MSKIFTLSILTIMLGTLNAYADTWVNSYTKSNGTHVEGHWRKDGSSSDESDYKYDRREREYRARMNGVMLSSGGVGFPSSGLGVHGNGPVPYRWDIDPEKQDAELLARNNQLAAERGLPIVDSEGFLVDAPVKVKVKFTPEPILPDSFQKIPSEDNRTVTISTKVSKKLRKKQVVLENSMPNTGGEPMIVFLSGLALSGISVAFRRKLIAQ